MTFEIPPEHSIAFQKWLDEQPEGSIPAGTAVEKKFVVYLAELDMIRKKVLQPVPTPEIDEWKQPAAGDKEHGKGDVIGPSEINYQAIAIARMARGDLLSFNNTIYRYEDGIYKEDNNKLNGEILRLLVKAGIGAKESVTNATNQVRHYIMYSDMAIEYPFNFRTDAIPLSNCVLIIDFATGKITPTEHSPEYKFNYKIKATYDPSAPVTPVEEYLKSLGVDMRILIQVPAHAMLSMLKRVYKREYFFKGKPDSGKSTYCNLVGKHLFGETNCSSLSLGDMLYEKFRLSELDGKICNICSDLGDTKLTDLGTFKKLTGGDFVTAEQKHKNPYQFVSGAVMIFSANKYPKIKTSDEAFWKRWIAVNFPKEFERKGDFELLLFTEKFISGFLNLALMRLTEMAQDPTDLVITESVEHDWMADNSSAYAFVRDEVERCPDAVCVKSDLYAQYMEWCNENEMEKESKKDLTTAAYHIGAIDGYKTVKGVRQHCYQGIKVRRLDPIYPDIELPKVTTPQTTISGVN